MQDLICPISLDATNSFVAPGVSEPTVPSIKSESKKTFEFYSNEFVPSVALFGFGKQANPQQVSAHRVQLPTTPEVLPSVVVPMKSLKMLLDKTFGIPSECSE